MLGGNKWRPEMLSSAFGENTFEAAGVLQMMVLRVLRLYKHAYITTRITRLRLFSTRRERDSAGVSVVFYAFILKLLNSLWFRKQARKKWTVVVIHLLHLVSNRGAAHRGKMSGGMSGHLQMNVIMTSCFTGMPDPWCIDPPSSLRGTIGTHLDSLTSNATWNWHILVIHHIVGCTVSLWLIA